MQFVPATLCSIRSRTWHECSDADKFALCQILLDLLHAGDHIVAKLRIIIQQI